LADSSKKISQISTKKNFPSFFFEKNKLGSRKINVVGPNTPKQKREKLKRKELLGNQYLKYLAWLGTN
jgi:hypothetical protein